MIRFLFLILLLPFLISAEEKKHHSTICLNMIVKNEAHVIKRCLQSVRPFIDYWVIVDTGSTDGTQGVIKEFMKDIPGELYERPWVNFAHNRNEALALGGKKSDYILFIDADDILTFSGNCARKNFDKDFYYVKIKYAGTTYDRILLAKSNLDWKWVGVVHETLICNTPAIAGNLDDISMIILGGGSRSHNPKKFQKDAELLEQALKDDPGNSRYTFYLAQSYRDAEMPEKALQIYEKRVAMGGWDQEVFWSLYQIALLQEILQFPENDICKSYHKAFSYHSKRAEPIYRLCNYYRRNENYLLGYLLSKFGLSIQHPADLLFVESWVYDYGMLLEFSICSYWIGQYEESFNACNQLLSDKELPPHVRSCVEKNLEFAIQKIPEKRNPALLKKAE
jgi:glycosyltransferase involved in cell wall biosynthesis